MAKRPWLAFVLNFLIPGAGLLYLHRWGLALANFLAVQSVLLTILLWQPDPEWTQHLHYPVLILMAASGGWAHALACQMRLQSDGGSCGA